MLSRAEQQVADWLVTGATNAEIAERLFVTDKTVKFHLTNVYKKSGVRSRTEYLVQYKSMGESRVKKEREFQQERGELMETNNLPTKQGYRQVQVGDRSQEDKINFVNEKFMVTDTLTQLHKMMTEVTSKEINPGTVNAACNCVARLNETVNTAIQAARFLSER